MGGYKTASSDSEATISINDDFWDERIAVTRTHTLHAIREQLQKTGRWDAFKLRSWKPGDPNKPHWYWDSDIAKFTESLCYALPHMSKDDPNTSVFTNWMNEAIGMIEQAQHPDGYINIYYTAVEPDRRWINISTNHELYCAGHLLEAAIAHFQYTKDSKFLDITRRYIDYICTVFGPEDNKLHGYPGHQEIELALMRLYKIVPEPRYLTLAQYFIEHRGQDENRFDLQQEKQRHEIKGGKFQPDLWIHENWIRQAELPIRKLEKIRGHAVRAMYYLTGVQALANVTHDDTLYASVDRLWRNMVDKKYFIHGGIGTFAKWERFGEDFELPLDCYGETCAGIGIMFLGQQMLQHRLSGEVASVMERTLYNNILGAYSLDGCSFFYNQPLKADGIQRSTWFRTSCCPPNVTRLLNSLERYIFTEMEGMVAVNLFIGSTYRKNGLEIVVSTRYPWTGKVEVSISSEQSIEFAIRAPPTKYSCSLKETEEDGYLHFAKQKWNDTITITWDILAKPILPKAEVSALKGFFALERGPFVYAMEECDAPLPLTDKALKVSETAEFADREIEVNGVKVVALKTQVEHGEVVFVPYFAWGNRRPGERMKIWIDRK